MDDAAFLRHVKEQFAAAQFVMLRWETELTPCTGITAVSKQERRFFRQGVTVAPWCGELVRASAKADPLTNGQVRRTGWRFEVEDRRCEVLVTTAADLPLILFVEIPGRFRGRTTPYDVPGEWPEHHRVGTLKRDALFFGLALERMLADAGSSNQFVWGADWETVPALVRARPRHLVALTLHNTFDECFEHQAAGFPAEYGALMARRPGTRNTKTALEVALEQADVVTTVNRGFSAGMRTEPLQREVMLNHLPWHLIDRVVGIDNAAFSPLSTDLAQLHQLMEEDFGDGSSALFELKAAARARLARERGIEAGGRVMVVSMGRRSAQKQHDLVVDAVRQLLTEEPALPLYAVFATTPEDGSEPRLEQMRQLVREFPSNVACFDGRIDFFHDLMTGADYNCMPSLYEPHGGAYEGTVVPIARAVDGLAEQICPLDPTPAAAAVAARWHPRGTAPTGFLFREEQPGGTAVHVLRELLSQTPSPRNRLFHAMTAALKLSLRQAVEVRRKQPAAYARLVQAALDRQQQSSWLVNLGGMLALVEQARARRQIQG